MASPETKSQDLISALMDGTDRDRWQDWLIDIQSHLISTGYCEALTKEAATNFAVHFANLQRFFARL